MMLLSEAAGYMDGEFLSNEEAWVTCVGSDSRHITQNELFFAIKGDNFDGHQYAEQALKQGATAVVIANKDCKVRPAILVEDTKKALGRLAAAWRATFTLPLVAITGSNGKTTVKEMLAAILNATDSDASESRAVLATQGNLNNDIGMPMTLLKLNAQHKFAVIEMGMNHLGEIDYLTRIAQPNVAVINNAGTAHIGEVGSRENIAKAKGEIFAGLSSDGIAVINADDAFADYWKSLNKNRKILTFGLDSKADVTATYEEVDDASQIQLTTPSGSIGFKLDMLGKHNVSNALAASTCAVALGVTNADIARGLKHFGGVKGRLQRKVGLNGASLIDDTYNANPDSMKAAIDVLANQAGKQIFVMGDMAELGAESVQMHAEIGAYAKQKGIDVLLALGENSMHAVQAFGANAIHYASLQALLDAASGAMKKDTTVLVKGSRFMQMERVVDVLEQKLTDQQMRG
jgi:UDP-N-acetylmuramoyl-tripeptide--D-alanyl-D-alanine ligase